MYRAITFAVTLLLTGCVTIDKEVRKEVERIGEQRESIEKKITPSIKILTSVNHTVNNMVAYREGKSAGDWPTPEQIAQRRIGDCEDFAILKRQVLINMGVSPEKLMFIFGHQKTKNKTLNRTQNIAHLVLGYYETTDSIPLILDNNKTAVVKLDEMRGFEPVYSMDEKHSYLIREYKNTEKLLRFTAKDSIKIENWKSN